MKLRFIILFFLPLTTLAQTLQEGQAALHNENYNKAKEIFTALIAKEPANADNYYYAGRLYKALGDKAKAKEMFTKGAAANAKAANNFIGLGSILLDEGDTVQAKANFDKAFAATPKDAKVNMLVGEAWGTSTGKKNVNRAIEFLNKSISIDKKSPDAHIILGDVYSQDPDKGGNAMSSYEHATEADPLYAKGYMKIALLFMRARNSDEARKAFESGANADPNYAPLFREFAEFYAAEKKYDKAAEKYKIYLSLTENTVENLTRYAQLQFLSKDYAGTIENSSKVLEKDASNITLKRLTGYSYYELGKYPEGLQYMEGTFKEMDPSKIIPSDYEYYGRLLTKTGNDSLAIEQLSKALALDSTEVDLYNDLGQALYKKKRYIEAAGAFDKKIKKSPKQLSADYFMLGKSYYFGGDSIHADSAFIKVTELSPNSHIGYMWRGRANSQIDATETKDLAKPYYEKTVELITDPAKYKKDLVEAYTFLGFNALQHDDEALAKSFYEKVLTVDPEDKDALSVLDQLKKRKEQKKP